MDKVSGFLQLQKYSSTNGDLSISNILSNTGIPTSSWSKFCPSLPCSFSSSLSSLLSSSLPSSLSLFSTSTSVFSLCYFLWGFMAALLGQYLPHVLRTLLSFHGRAMQIKCNNIIIEALFRNSFYQ